MSATKFRKMVIFELDLFGMGWIVLIAVYPLWKAMGMAAVLWIGAGGIAYLLGVIFYAMKRIKYMHAIWHIFVLVGTLIYFKGCATVTR